MIMNKVINRLKRIYKIYILKDKFLSAHREWVKDKGDGTLRLNYDLNRDSIVFDLGGYKGDFAYEMYDRYKCKVFVFEPVKDYYEHIQKRFSGNENVKVFHFGLSNEDTQLEISVSESASSIYNNNSRKKEIIELKSIMNFIEENKIDKIDLFKINIEGGEFDVLPAMIKADYIKNITDLQIQFHTFVENSEEKRKAIQKELEKTHKLTYNYWFIWENWKNVKK